MNKVFEQGLNVLITVLDKLPKKKEETVNNGYEHCHNTEIYHLRNAKLDEKLMYQLAPFINSYRPHDKPLNRVQLRAEFGPPCTTVTPLSFKAICKQTKAL